MLQQKVKSKKAKWQSGNVNLYKNSKGGLPQSDHSLMSNPTFQSDNGFMFENRSPVYTIKHFLLHTGISTIGQKPIGQMTITPWANIVL